MTNKITTLYGIDDSFYDFVEKHSSDDTVKLLLSKKNQDYTFDLKFAALQIDCRKRIAKKLPDIAQLKCFLFPTLLSTEQCTSQVVAKFHATLLSGYETVLDLTAGLGIDDFYIASTIKSLTSVEINPLVASALQHNMQLYRPNITVVNDDATNYLNNKVLKPVDAVFIDPARRDGLGKRTFGFSDCEPNVLNLLDQIKTITNTLFIKASPMIDITQSITEMKQITDIWVAGVGNECKELLFKLDLKNVPPSKVNVHTLNFENEQSCQALSFSLPRNQVTPITYCNNLLTFLYEPNCCIMKASAFTEIVAHYPDIYKLGIHTHLFTSTQFYSDFPGRIFRVLEIVPFKEKFIKRLQIQYPKANISTRNFKLSAPELKNKLKINDGGDVYIFAVTLHNGDKSLIITHKA